MKNLSRLRDFVTSLPSLKKISGPFNSDFDISKVIFFNQENALWIENPFGNGGVVVSNVFSNRKNISLALNCEEHEVLDIFSNLLKRVELNKAKFKSKSVKELFVELNGIRRDKVPFFQYFEKDKGPYITSSVVVAKSEDPEYINMSIHRLLVLDEMHLAIRMVEGRHLHRIYENNKRKNKNTNVAILVGASPPLLLSASTSLPLGKSELDLAYVIKGSELEVSNEFFDFPIPLETEFLILAEISKDKMTEEFMTDILMTYDTPRLQPVLQVKHVFMHENSVYHAILPSSLEHKILMGFPRLASIKRALLDKGIKVKDVSLTPGSGGWLHAVVSIRKEAKSDGKETILTVLNEHRSVKGVIVVDDDIDVNDYEDVDFAIATRLKDRSQIIWLEGLRGSTLDPSSDQTSQTTIKWGLDLTLDEVNVSRFRRAKIP